MLDQRLAPASCGLSASELGESTKVPLECCTNAVYREPRTSSCFHQLCSPSSWILKKRMSLWWTPLTFAIHLFFSMMPKRQVYLSSALTDSRSAHQPAPNPTHSKPTASRKLGKSVQQSTPRLCKAGIPKCHPKKRSPKHNYHH